MFNLKNILTLGLQTLLIPSFVMLYFLSCLIKKNKNIWLFSAWFGKKFSDNPKYLFQYLLDKKEIKCFWLTKNYKLYKELKNKNVNTIYAYSLKGFYYQLIAGIIVFTHSSQTEYISFLIGERTKKIHLYHGMPIKYIENDSKYSKSRSAIYKKASKFIPYLAKKFDLVISIGEENKKIFKSAFRGNFGRIKITGFPRNDHLIKYKKKSTNRKILYLPTFRGEYGSEYLLLKETNFNFERIDTICSKLKVNFHIKLHPGNFLKKTDINKIEKLKNLAFIDSQIDTYDILAEYDIFITDFSGIYFDLLLLDKPIFIKEFQIKKYLTNDRDGFYFDVKNLIGSNTNFNGWEKLFKEITDIKNISNNLKITRKNKKKFHKFIDSNSCSRVYAEIEKLML
jgi:CDP-glycerol glycerophosphotransferase (TagB/SpsB family)